MARRSTYNPEQVDDDTPLRVSKSSFMKYKKCPRQYWWNYIAMPDVRPPATEEMLRGTGIHSVMEDVLLHQSLNCNVPIVMVGDDVEQAYQKVAEEKGYGGDGGVDAMAQIINDIAEQWGGFVIEELEKKHEIVIAHEIAGDPVKIEMVGMIDGVFRNPQGGLVIVELKTGNANSSKLTRTRQELCFYRKILMLAGYDEPTHFLTIFPDADDVDFLTKMTNKKNTEVFMGLEKGLAVYEPISKRSISAFEKAWDEKIADLMNHHFPIKWNEYFCTQWCDFHLSCNEEILDGQF